jgi:hypothetical protein
VDVTEIVLYIRSFNRETADRHVSATAESSDSTRMLLISAQTTMQTWTNYHLRVTLSGCIPSRHQTWTFDEPVRATPDLRGSVA